MRDDVDNKEKFIDNVFLMEFYDIFYETLMLQMEIICYMLEMQKNPLDLLFEYNIKVFSLDLSVKKDFFF